MAGTEDPLTPSAYLMSGSNPSPPPGKQGTGPGPHVSHLAIANLAGPGLAQHRSYDSTPLPDSPRPPSFWSLRDLFSAQTQTHWGSDCPGQEELPRLLLCSQPTGLMCWGPRGHHHLGSQAHTSTYMSSASLQRTLLRMLNSKDRERHWECWQAAGLRASSLGLCRPSPSSRLPLGSLRRSLACGPVSCGGV